MKRPVSLRGLLSWQFSLAGVLPLLLVIVALLGYLLPSFERTLRERDKVLASAVTEQVMTFLGSAELALNSAAFMLRKGVALSLVSPMLDALAANEGATDALLLIDYEGMVSGVGLPPRTQPYRDNFIGLSQVGQPHVREALERGKPVWSQTYLSPVSAQVVIARAVPVDGQVLVAEVNVEKLSRSVSALREEGGVFAVLLDRSGRIVAHPDPRMAREQVNLSDIPLVRQGMRGEIATGHFPVDGKDYFGSTVPIPQLGWVALIGQPADTVFGPLYAAAAITVIGVLLAAAMLLYVGNRTATRVAGRMELVAARARAIVDGGEVDPLPPTRVVEFARIGATLDAIFERLRTREAEVRNGAERLRTLLEGAPMGVIELRVEPSGGHFIVGINPQVQRVLGLPAEGALGHTLQGVFPGFDNTALAHACSTVASEGGSIESPGYEYQAPGCARVLDIFTFRHHAGVVALCFHDVTERVRAEHALRESELRFSAAFLAVPDYVTLSRASDGTIYDANEAFERITGIPREAAIGRTSVELGIFVHPEQRRLIAKGTLEDGRVDRFPIEMWRADRTVIEGVVSTRLVEIAGEACMVAVMRDETEVRRAQRTLQRLAAAGVSGGLRSLLDAAVEGVGAGVAVLARASAADAVTLSGLRTVQDEEGGLALPAPALARAIEARAFADWTPPQDEAERLAQAFGFHPVSIVVAPVRSDEGGAEALLVAFGSALQYAETTRSLIKVVAERIGQEFARLHAEQELRRSQQLFSQLFHASPVALVVSRLPRFAILDCNEVFCRQYGIPREHAIGRNGAELGIWADIEDRKALLADLLARRESAGREAWMHGRDGNSIRCALTARVVRDGDDDLLILSLVDVTAIRRAEQEVRELNATLEKRVEERTVQLVDANLELSNALQRLERAKDELVQSEKMAALGGIVAGVAHELNTPIGNCLTVTSTLSEATEDLLRESEQGLRRSTLKDYLGTAEQASEILMRNLTRAAELVASFKQVAVDRASSKRRDFRISEVVAETLLMLRPTLKTKPYQIETSVAEDVVMSSYPGPLGQVLTNLVNNAVLHGFEGRTQGKVRIDVSCDSGERVRIAVSDDGAGISEAMQRRVFDPFFTTKLGHGGSGLGLHIVHTIVTGLLGGTVELQSQPGAGTTVILTVPSQAPLRDDPD
ncbi:hypothetical protein GCM10025771_37110 [Niveibacterium umoris]|uniref:histidine kinase n=1 Tax=Niveibacterium umoris TaxID=1193620 RepID=A0A840BC25_9RHOO|nr:ATP-binding protein [Niveibacterium umoris]MBB4011091.1 PAS domain S-box-containing protein [Niveibacterium umoris]